MEDEDQIIFPDEMDERIRRNRDRFKDHNFTSYSEDSIKHAIADHIKTKHCFDPEYDKYY